ncbi:MAG: DnaB-like helicase N-terminal domain-containing protein [Cyanobacteria bacterium P01_A01_bin.84]
MNTSELSFRPHNTLPPSSIEVEEEVLGALIFDPNAIYIVADFLPTEAFYISAHKLIYKACLDLYKQKQPCNALTVTSWLIDNKKLAEVGGRNKIASLLDRTMHSLDVKHNAEILQEKYVRRQLQKIGFELLEKAHETEIPTSYLLENIERNVLQVTGIRKKDKGYWQQRDEIAFNQLCKDLEEAEEIENTAQRDWVMKKLAKKWRFSNKKELLDFHAKWLDSQNKVNSYSAKQYFEKYGNVEQDWLIPGFIPARSVMALYADGGVGKTRLAFTLTKYAVTGGTFPYDGAKFDPMNVLLIETDQGSLNTCKLLEMQDLLESDRLEVCDEWSVGEFGRLKTMIEKHKPKLVIVDSLTSISAQSIYSEKDTEYARPLIRLRQFSKEYGCTFLVIHHSNANGDMRGSRAIRNTVDEVYKFSKQQNEIGSFNVLNIEKSRSRAPGAYKFTYDDDSWGWKFEGRLEDELLGNNSISTNIMNRCLNFLRASKGTPFEAQEVAEELGINKDTVRRDLRRASAEGLVNTGRSIRNKKALIYYIGVRNNMLSNITSDQKIPSDQPPLITHDLSPENDIAPSDQVINIFEKKIESDEKNSSDQLIRSLDQKTENLDIDRITENKPSDQGSDPRSHISLQSESNCVDQIQNENSNCVDQIQNELLSNITSDHGSDPPKAPTSITDVLPVSCKLESKTKVHEVNGVLGNWQVEMTPTRQTKKHKQVEFVYASPDGEQASNVEKITGGVDEAKRIAHYNVQAFEKQIIEEKGLTFKVLNTMTGEWVENCISVSIPRPPGILQYIFKSPGGKLVVVAGENEFEVVYPGNES